LLSWLRKRFGERKAEPAFERVWIVDSSGQTIKVTEPNGATDELAKADLTNVVIETNDTGPWGADVWWRLVGLDEKAVVTVPHGATGETMLLDYLLGLPGFEHAEMTSVMCCTDNAVFQVWNRRL
jgi:hypothetical protein